MKRDLDTLEQRLELRFEAIDHRFDAIDRRFESLEDRIDLRFEASEHKLLAAFRGELQTALTAAAFRGCYSLQPYGLRPPLYEIRPGPVRFPRFTIGRLSTGPFTESVPGRRKIGASKSADHQ